MGFVNPVIGKTLTIGALKDALSTFGVIHAKSDAMAVAAVELSKRTRTVKLRDRIQSKDRTGHRAF